MAHSNTSVQISRLYRPLDADYVSDSEEDDSAQLLPSHYIPTSTNPTRTKPSGTKPNNLSDVWDEREELFGVGDDSDEEDVLGRDGTSGERGRPVTPKITVTES